MIDISLLYKKSTLLLDTQGGVIITLLSLIFSFFAPDLLTFGAVIVAIIADGIFGTIASVKNGSYLLSSLGRQTVIKVSSYLTALILAMLFERLIHLGTAYTAKALGALIIACEFWSFSAHVIVIFPNSIFFKLFNKYLKGEIESKTGQKLE